jgi:pyridoxal phosphate enzyme (YggS family)
METLVQRLSQSLASLRSAIAETCAAAGRDPASVEILAVSKYATAVETLALARVLAAAGLPPRLGENRVQSLVGKAAELAGEPLGLDGERAGPILWDLIGSLQRNKAAQALRVVDRIHSLDRDEILRWLDRLAGESGRRVRGFLQVNVSGEGSKHGYAPAEVPPALELAATLPNLSVEGFMTMAPRGTDHETARPAFAALRELRDRCQQYAPGLIHLSMGMSQDWRGAILEGATILRVGSALFAAPEQ